MKQKPFIKNLSPLGAKFVITGRQYLLLTAEF